MQLNLLVRLTCLLLAYVCLPPAVQAQQTTGTPGSPDATTTIDGRYLPPPPPPPFQGVIKPEQLLEATLESGEPITLGVRGERYELRPDLALRVFTGGDNPPSFSTA